jgi:hypothetical protein
VEARFFPPGPGFEAAGLAAGLEVEEEVEGMTEKKPSRRDWDAVDLDFSSFLMDERTRSSLFFFFVIGEKRKRNVRKNEKEHRKKKRKGKWDVLEALVLDEIVHQGLFVRDRPLELPKKKKKIQKAKPQNFLAQGPRPHLLNVHGHLGVLEQLPRGLVRPVLGDGMLALVEILDDGLEVPMLADELERAVRADALDRVAIVASQQDAEVDELIK